MTPHPVFFLTLGGLEVSDHVPRVGERDGTQCDQKEKRLPPRPKRNHEQNT